MITRKDLETLRLKPNKTSFQQGKSMNQSGDDIIDIDGQRYLVPTRLIDGELVPDPDRKIKIPVEITSSFRFTKASTEIVKIQKRSFKQRLVSLITFGAL
jgi:hypothetical protein